MQILETLDKLQRDARQDEELRRKLLETRAERDPMDAFCKLCQELGYPVYLIDLVEAGEEFYASMRRSTNGGGENSPKLDFEDDFYELFFAALR